jgi:hypothetical protein
MNKFHNQSPLSGELKFSPYRRYHFGVDASKLSTTEIMILGLILIGVSFYY